MKTELNFLSEQLEKIYKGDPWYGAPIKTQLQSFPVAHAFDHPTVKLHCAAELVAHIIAYRQFLQKRLEHDDDFIPDQENTFNWKVINKKQSEAWQTLRDQLENNQQQLLGLIAQQDDVLLDEPVSGKPYDFRYLIHGIIQHDIYHMGQISYINRFYEEQKKTDIKIHKSSLVPDHPVRPTKEDAYKQFSYEALAYSK